MTKGERNLQWYKKALAAMFKKYVTQHVFDDTSKPSMLFTSSVHWFFCTHCGAGRRALATETLGAAFALLRDDGWRVLGCFVYCNNCIEVYKKRKRAMRDQHKEVPY
jgi:hypothetical protein